MMPSTLRNGALERVELRALFWREHDANLAVDLLSERMKAGRTLVEQLASVAFVRLDDLPDAIALCRAQTEPPCQRIHPETHARMSRRSRELMGEVLVLAAAHRERAGDRA